jgi:hypothetical protein
MAVDSACAREVPVCSAAQLLGYAQPADEVTAHRQFTLPTVSYPFASKLDANLGMLLTLKVDESGQVVCYKLTGRFDEVIGLNAQRRSVIDNLGAWRYSPFLRDGKAVTSVFSEFVNEQEMPERHLPLPEVPLDKVEISLARSGCYGTCPSYSVDVHGDGRVVYNGSGYVVVEGRHEFRIPVDDVARLVESLRAKDLWSLRPRYTAGVTDNPTYILSLRVGEQTHQLEDYVGQWAGMPSTVSDFEEEVDKVAHANHWLHLSQEAIEQLKSEGFDFHSAAAAELLARAVEDEESDDDQAMLSILQLGAPIDGKDATNPLIQEALRHRRSALIDPLIAAGALNSGGRADQKKIDAAFDAAIAGGRLALVQRLWAVSGDTPHPSFTFDDHSAENSTRSVKSSVILLLEPPRYPVGEWEGLEIAQWFVAQGGDLKASAADKRTLLHIAAKAGDARFVRYLLDQGLDASTPGEYGLPALGSVEDEDIALILLEAGSNLAGLESNGHPFRDYAEYNHWQRVVAWLDAHNGKPR